MLLMKRALHTFFFIGENCQYRHRGWVGEPLEQDMPKHTQNLKNEK